MIEQPKSCYEFTLLSAESPTLAHLVGRSVYFKTAIRSNYLLLFEHQPVG